MLAGRLIRRSTKMFIENVDGTSPGGYEKERLVFTKIALESTLPPHSDGAVRRVSERIESCFYP